MSTVFVDIDTQIDFLYPAGALYVPGAEALTATFARLNAYAAAHGAAVVSTTDAHSEDDPEFRVWPPHCVTGTAGQQKPCATLLEKRVVVPAASGDYAIEGAQQIVVEKHHIDVFAESNLHAIVGKLGAERYVVYGVVTEYCVRTAALGLLRLGKRVEVLADAIQTLRREDSDRALAEVTAAGGHIATAAAILGR